MRPDYVALGAFVATTISIGLTYFVPRAGWVPAALGIVGTLILFYASLLLIREAVNSELAFARTLRGLYEQRSRTA